MIKKIHIFYIIIFFQFAFANLSFSKIEIIASVDGEIITNYDVLKEDRYLKILSPKLNNLSKKQTFELAKQSLIREIIKKKEISKFIDLSEENLFIDEYLKNLIVKLGYKDKNSFISDLLKFKTYNMEELKLKTKIEIYWNELIFSRFNDSIIINKKKLSEKIDNLQSEKKRELLLSEIVFNKKGNEKLETLIFEIQKSIDEIGFSNTANIYSVSESSKFGGKVGWINTDSLSDKIYKEIKNLKVDDISDVIKVENNFMILRIDDIKIITRKINKEKELEKLIQIERNNKLEKFSRIYFNKTKTNYMINEK